MGHSRSPRRLGVSITGSIIPRTISGPTTRRLTALVLLVAVALAGTACVEDAADPSEAPDGMRGIVPQGKADNYFSTEGQEYTVSGRTTGVRDEDCLTRNADALDPEERCILEAVGLKNFAVAWFLNQYIIDKHDAPNEDWGGFTAMTRPQSFEALETGTPDDTGVFEYTFTSELSGPLDLLEQMPTEPCADGTDARCFTLEIPVLDNDTLSQVDTGSEWYRRSPYSKYSPETYDGETETLDLRIEPYPRSNDAFLEYDKLFDEGQMTNADGALKIGLFVGWDYYDDRYDLQTAEELYRWLTEEKGFESPAADYESYGIDSGDLTRTIEVQGAAVDVAVRLVHPGQGDPSDPAFAGEMKQALIDAFANRQVIAYEGHAGPLYGFALADWNSTDAGELDDSELPFLDIPSDFYQVVLASGCDTYMVADSLYKIPVKADRIDLDVITTSSFSNAAGRGRTTKALVDAVVNQDADDGGLAPVTYGELLRDLNSEIWMTPIYGVHGIDDNPRDNPFAAKDLLCEPCETNDDCGGHGNLCVWFGEDMGARCTTLCQTDADCGEGEACFAIYEGNAIVDHQCAPETLVCE